MKQNSFLKREFTTVIHFLLIVLIAIVFIGCGARQTQPTQSQTNFQNNKTSVEITGYSLLKPNEGLPYRHVAFQITNNKITNNDEVLGPPNNTARAKEGHQIVVLSVKIATTNERKWTEAVTSAQLVDQNGNATSMDLIYIKGAFRPRQIFAFDLSGFNPSQQTKIAFQMEDPLPPQLKLKILNRDMGFLEDMAKN